MTEEEAAWLEQKFKDQDDGDDLPLDFTGR